MRPRTFPLPNFVAPVLFAIVFAASPIAILANAGESAAVTAAVQEVPFSGQQLPASSGAEAELQTGIALTRSGKFVEAIPHFLAARSHVQDEYAASFNLALCYVGTSQFPAAIRILEELRASGRSRSQSGADAGANIENLLAQAYIGNNQNDEAFAALQRAAALAPKNEKLYLLVADAASDRQNYSLGLRIIDVALRNLPGSARLHYQRAYFLALLDDFDDAKPVFDRAIDLAPKTEIGYLAAAQKSYFAGDMPAAIRAARTAVQQGHENYLLLTILGDALVRSGADPCMLEFAEAKAALIKAVEERPNYVTAQIALGNLLLIGYQPQLAIDHLEKARQLDPRNPSVYSHLAVAYRQLHKQQDADAALAVLAKLNADEAARINAAPGDRKAIPGMSGGTDRPHP